MSEETRAEVVLTRGGSKRRAIGPESLPDWAEEWVPGRCGCGARLCRAACYCGGHLVCSLSGWAPDKCIGQNPKEKR